MDRQSLIRPLVRTPQPASRGRPRIEALASAAAPVRSGAAYAAPLAAARAYHGRPSYRPMHRDGGTSRRQHGLGRRCMRRFAARIVAEACRGQCLDVASPPGVVPGWTAHDDASLPSCPDRLAATPGTSILRTPIEPETIDELRHREWTVESSAVGACRSQTTEPSRSIRVVLREGCPGVIRIRRSPEGGCG